MDDTQQSLDERAADISLEPEQVSLENHLYLTDDKTDWHLRARLNGELKDPQNTYINLSSNVWYPDFPQTEGLPGDVEAALGEATRVYLGAHQEPFASQVREYAQRHGIKIEQIHKS